MSVGQLVCDMSDPVFFERNGPFAVQQVCDWTGAALAEGADGACLLHDIAPIDFAGPGDLTFLDNPLYASKLAQSRASACIVAPKYISRAPEGMVLLVSNQPYRAFAVAAGHFYPQSLKPGSIFGEPGISPGAHIHQSAVLEDGVSVDPGAVVGAGAEVGRGTVIAAGAVIGPNVKIGRDCSIGPTATLVHALVGNRVIVHAGVRIGQDGFGFAMGPQGHLKVPQVGRVIIQDDVEIGANTSIDRGATRDTVIGEGTKIDNQVQIGHNVVIGRHCIIVAQTGISGSVELEDFVAIGGQVGIIGHLKIGMGAQIAASSRVKDDVPPGARWGGAPAKPVREWFREVSALRRLAARDGRTAERGNDD